MGMTPSSMVCLFDEERYNKNYEKQTAGYD
jgi:hypothetical protein